MTCIFILYVLQVLSLKQTDLATITTGHVINLIASDLQRFQLTAKTIAFLFKAILELCTVSFLMYYLFGWESLSGICFLIMLSLYYATAGRICATLRTKISKVADERVNMMNSIISGIRTVKIYAWETPFMERVQRLRR